jgi:hypothetical protein
MISKDEGHCYFENVIKGNYLLTTSDSTWEYASSDHINLSQLTTDSTQIFPTSNSGYVKHGAYFRKKTP